MSKAKILVACHKPYWISEDPIYLPVHVGKATSDVSLPFQGDDTGENISALNPNYCELTALYWGWKNTSSEYLGLCHYRRYFAKSSFGDKKSRVLDEPSLHTLLSQAPILLPKPRHYWIETNASHYEHAHHKEDLTLTREIISRQCPEYLSSFDTVMKRTWGHRFNMLVMRCDYLDAYCSWLFPILFQLQEELDITQYSVNDARVFGFVGERLLDVWLLQTNAPSKDIPYVFLEQQNWLKKGFSFLLRKFLH